MVGVQFLVDEQGNKTAVVIDLKKNGQLWEKRYWGQTLKDKLSSKSDA